MSELEKFLAECEKWLTVDDSLFPDERKMFSKLTSIIRKQHDIVEVISNIPVDFISIHNPFRRLIVKARTCRAECDEILKQKDQ